MPMTEPERRGTARQGWAAFEALRRTVSRISRRGRRYARAVVQGARRDRAATGAPDRDPPVRVLAERAGERLLPQLLPLLRAARRSPHRRRLALLAAGIVAVILANAAAQIGLNFWQGAFYGALQRRDLPAFARELLTFAPIAGVLLALVVAQTWLQETAKVALREWLTRDLLDEWLVPRRAALLGLRRPGRHQPRPAPARGRAPPRRALGRPRRRPAPGLAPARQLRGRALGAVGAGGVRDRRAPARRPGLHGVVRAGLRLPRLLADLARRPPAGPAQRRALRPRGRAPLRARPRQRGRRGHRADGGEREERLLLGRALGRVVALTRRLAGGTARLAWITSGYGWLTLVVPFVAAAPGYFGGELSFGGLMVLVGAFNQVQQALRWFVDNYARIADWRATLARVATFREALLHLEALGDRTGRIELVQQADESVRLEDVSLCLANGRATLDPPRVEIRPGERVLVVGAPGGGKSTLFRAMAGLWPCGAGRILMPPRDEVLFLPQRPYLPAGTLRAAVARSARFADGAVEAALARVGLDRLAPDLDREGRWDRELSAEQQQRLAFARVLLHAPRWVLLDAADSALDEEGRRRVLSIFADELAGTAVIGFGSAPGPDGFYGREVRLIPVPGDTGLGLHARRRPTGTPPLDASATIPA